MANEFRIKKGLIVNGSGSTILDIQGSQGQLFSVTDQLSGSLFSVNDISGIPVIEAFSDTTVKIGQYLSESIVVSGSNARITGSLFGTASWALNALTASFVPTSSLTGNFFVQGGNSFGTQATLGTNDTQNLAFETNGSTRMFISSSGNVGIGTTIPSASLHVATTGKTLQLGSNADNGGAGVFFAGSSTNKNWFIGNQYNVNDTLEFTPSAATGSNTIGTSPSMVITSAGNVGIGTNNPVQKLHVQGNIYLPSSNFITYNNGDVELGVSGSYNFVIRTYTGAAMTEKMRVTSGGNVGIGTTSPTAKLHVSGSNTDGLLLINSPASSSILVVSGSGNVGIGTATPVSQLHVQAPDSVTGTIFVKGGKNTVTSIGEINSQLDFGSNDTSINNTNNIGGRIASVTEFSNGAYAGMAFYTFQQGRTPNLQEAVRIAYDGNVGIGITNPTTKLHVSGTTGGVFEVDGAAAVNALYVSSSGTVGIGTTTPTLATLQVNGNVYATSYTGSLFGTSSWASNAVSSSYALNSTSASYALNATSASFAATASFVPTSSLTGNFFVQGGNSFGAQALLGTNDVQNLAFETSGSVRMTISGSNGSVGIGTASPNALVEIFNSTQAGSNEYLRIFGSSNAGSLSLSLYPSTNQSYGFIGSNVIYSSGGISRINTSIGGTGIALNKNTLDFYTGTDAGNPTLKMTLDASGSLGLGVTPSAWQGNVKAIQISDSGAGIAASNNAYSGGNNIWINNNSFQNSSVQDIYTRTATAGQYWINGNSHKWLIAPSGTAGNVITFTQAMTLAATGNLLVGTTTDGGQKLQVNGNVFATSYTGSLQGTSSWANNSLTASSADNFLVRGTLTAQTIVAQVITSSQDFVTGSTRFGSLITNTHLFTGSVSITGSLNVVGGVTGSLLGTSSWASNAISSSYALNATSASFATTASFVPTSSLTGNFFVQGGNSFGAQAILGTNDVQNLAFETSGSVRMFISSSGNVGIGTTSPQKPLEVISTASDFASIGANQISVGQWTGIHFGYRESNNLYRKSAIIFERTDLTLNNAQGKVHILNGPQGNANNATLADARLTIAENGNVGINATSPIAKLQISGSNTDGLLLINSPASSSILVVSGSGNVGIGTTSPSYQLDLGGGTTVNTRLRLQRGSDDTNQYGIYGWNQINLYRANVSTGSAQTDFSINQVGSDGSRTPFYISTGGNIGIGTTTPTSASLQVNGNVFATSYTGSLQGTSSWAQNVITASFAQNALTASFISGTVAAFPYTGSAQITGSLGVTGSISVSGSTGTVFFSNADTMTFTGSYFQSGSAIITGSLNVTNGITGSLLGTASWANNTLTASYGNATSTVGFGIGGSQIYYASVLSSTSPSTVNVFTNDTGSFTSAFYNYTVSSGSNARSGQISAVWVGNSIQYNDYSTVDIGTTSAVTASVAIVTGQVQLNVQVPSSTAGWRVKSTATYI